MYCSCPGSVETFHGEDFQLEAPLSKIDVGTRVMMELAGMKDKLQSFFVGYIKNRCVITIVPQVPEVNRPTLLENLYRGNTITLRYIHSGMVLGFTTEIMHVSFTPLPLLFVKYPEQIESYNLRKDERVGCLFPASVVHEETEFSGALSDISLSGCGIVLPVNGNQGITVEIDDTLALYCPLLFGSDQAEVPSVVKRIIKSGAKIELGLKFATIPEELRSRINEYIEQTVIFMDAS